MHHPLFSLHLSILLFGLSGVFIGSIQASTYGVVLGRVVCSCVALFLLLALRKKSWRPQRSHLGLIVLGGALLALHWICFVRSIQVGTVAIATITFATAPLTVSVLEPLVFHEKPPAHSGLLACLTLIGVAITVPSYSLGNQAFVATLWGLTAAMTYALLTLVNRKVAPFYDGMQLSAWQHSTVALICLPLVVSQGTFLQPGDYLPILALGVICTAGGYVCFVQAQQAIAAQTVALVSSLETLYSIVFACIFLAQVPTLRQMLGGFLILAVALWSSGHVTILAPKETYL